ERLGATLQTRGGVDTIRIKLFTLTRYLPELLVLAKEMIQSPAFDERELELYKANKIERLKIDLRKNEVIAYRKLTEAIYGKAHPYGLNTEPDDYMAIRALDLKSHHQHFILPGRGMITLAGQFDDHDEALIRQTFENIQFPDSNGQEEHQVPKPKSAIGYFGFDGPQSHQAAIRIGRRLFTQHHPDFDGLFVLNTILGGYFGSRLMNEIREQQGLTYGIYSGLDSFALDGCLYISTETATANIDVVIKAIGLEVEKLRQELVPEPELNMARNYLMGHLMTQLDGPFSSMDYIKTLKIEGLADASFDRLVKTVQEITPETLRSLAQQYLDLDQWATIVVR
ncbi:MAG TPA: pitrilysin family protein, partial [Saprospiraceae bacterium]|nr:pitrilysin family protein [Saprospiraceae bacterium]